MRDALVIGGGPGGSKHRSAKHNSSAMHAHFKNAQRDPDCLHDAAVS